MRSIKDDVEKLKRLLPHWIKHNDEHTKIYKDWAERMSSLGKKELSEILEAIHQESQELRELFEEAIRVVES